jgi:putative SOS response-associated peptidase YedK
VDVPPLYNVRPGSDIPAVLTSRKSGEREAHLFHWGLIPSWAKDKKVGYKMINARAEGIADKPAFRQSFRQRRCIIPAAGFYEWQKPTKQPFYFQPVDDSFFSFAGVWERWKSPAGELVLSCSIITTAANDVVAPIHDRMPVILPDAGAADWWLSDSDDAGMLQTFLAPYPAGRMTSCAGADWLNKTAPQNSA